MPNLVFAYRLRHERTYRRAEAHEFKSQCSWDPHSARPDSTKSSPLFLHLVTRPLATPELTMSASPVHLWLRAEVKPFEHRVGLDPAACAELMAAGQLRQLSTSPSCPLTSLVVTHAVPCLGVDGDLGGWRSEMGCGDHAAPPARCDHLGNPSARDIWTLYAPSMCETSCDAPTASG